MPDVLLPRSGAQTADEQITALAAPVAGRCGCSDGSGRPGTDRGRRWGAGAGAGWRTTSSRSRSPPTVATSRWTARPRWSLPSRPSARRRWTNSTTPASCGWVRNSSTAAARGGGCALRDQFSRGRSRCSAVPGSALLPTFAGRLPDPRALDSVLAAALGGDGAAGAMPTVPGLPGGARRGHRTRVPGVDGVGVGVGRAGGFRPPLDEAAGGRDPIGTLGRPADGVPVRLSAESTSAPGGRHSTAPGAHVGGVDWYRSVDPDSPPRARGAPARPRQEQT